MRALIARGFAGREGPTVGVAGTTRAGDESGFVLIVAILMLLVVTLLVGAIATAAVDVNNSSTQTIARDRALAAAQAGLQAGLFRLNLTGGSTGATGTLGNGASYTYSVSSLSASGSPCRFSQSPRRRSASAGALDRIRISALGCNRLSASTAPGVRPLRRPRRSEHGSCN